MNLDETLSLFLFTEKKIQPQKKSGMYKFVCVTFDGSERQ